MKKTARDSAGGTSESEVHFPKGRPDRFEPLAGDHRALLDQAGAPHREKAEPAKPADLSGWELLPGERQVCLLRPQAQGGTPQLAGREASN